MLCLLQSSPVSALSVCRFKSYFGTSSVCRADSWSAACRRRKLSALQTLEVPLDGANTADSSKLKTALESTKWKWILYFFVLYWRPSASFCSFDWAIAELLISSEYLALIYALVLRLLVCRRKLVTSLTQTFYQELWRSRLKIQIEDFTYPAMFRDRSTSFIC